MSVRLILSLVTWCVCAQAASRRKPYRLIEPQRWRSSSSELNFADPALTVPLGKTGVSSPSQKYLRTVVAPATNQTRVFADALEASYTTNITFGDKTFTAIVDTGSADTWVVENNFTCIDPYAGGLVDPLACGFGPTYMPGGTFRQIPDQNFMTVYGDGETLSGIMGYETVTLANITVPQQQIALVNTAYYFGDGIASALIGLAYPNLTSAYPGLNTSKDDLGIGNTIPYAPIFTNMYQKTGIPPVFSLALSRDNDTGGLLAFGGLPKGVTYTGDFISAPIKLMQLTQQTTNGSVISYVYTFYAIAVEGISIATTGDTVTPNSSAPAGSPLSEALGNPFTTAASPISFTVSEGSSRSVRPSSSAEPDVTSEVVPRPGDGSVGTVTTITDYLPTSPTSTVDSDPTKSEPLFDFSTPTRNAESTSSAYQPPGTWWRSRMRRQTIGHITPSSPMQQTTVYIVDSGTTLLYVPDQIADAINNAFDPPAYYDIYTGEYFVDCNARAPIVSIRINGNSFRINPADLILHNVTPIEGAEIDPDEPTPCGSGVAAAGQNGMYVLGDVFLKNVLAVFDIGAAEMRFAARD